MIFKDGSEQRCDSVLVWTLSGTSLCVRVWGGGGGGGKKGKLKGEKKKTYQKKKKKKKNV